MQRNLGQYTGSCKGGPPNKGYAADGEAQAHAKAAGQAANAGDLARAAVEAVAAVHNAQLASTPAAITAALQAVATVADASEAVEAAKRKVDNQTTGISGSTEVTDYNPTAGGGCDPGYASARVWHSGGCRQTILPQPIQPPWPITLPQKAEDKKEEYVNEPTRMRVQLQRGLSDDPFENIGWGLTDGGNGRGVTAYQVREALLTLPWHPER